METDRHRIPDRVDTVHLIAACGTGMGALGAMLKDLGHTVSGSDENVYPPMSTFLEARGIPVTEGFRRENLAHRPDLVVVGNTVRRENPEAAAMREMGLNFCSLPEALNRFVAEGRRRLVVTGTHGKTTTASLLSWVLYSAGRDPSFMIGGIVNNFSGNYRLGNGDSIVIEGDEYDTAYFDKGPKFLHYHPDVAILTGIEFDHADIYRDLDHVKAAFRTLIESLPGESLLIAFDRDENVSGLVERAPCRVSRYGRESGSTWQLGRTIVETAWTRFEVIREGRPFGQFRIRMPGEHNLANALAVIAAADAVGIGPDAAAAALETFEGVRRRQEVRGEKGGVTVMDDFAHHPTAVRETIRALKGRFPEGRLVAVFEPRTNSSMRRVFQKVYPEAFDGADLICIRQPPLLHKIPPDDRFSSERLVSDLVERGKTAHFFPDTESILDFLVAEARDGDLVLIMSNGGFDNIHERLLDRL